jgi:hypothetical protein
MRLRQPGKVHEAQMEMNEPSLNERNSSAVIYHISTSVDWDDIAKEFKMAEDTISDHRLASKEEFEAHKLHRIITGNDDGFGKQMDYGYHIFEFNTDKYEGLKSAFQLLGLPISGVESAPLEWDIRKIIRESIASQKFSHEFIKAWSNYHYCVGAIATHYLYSNFDSLYAQCMEGAKESNYGQLLWCALWMKKRVANLGKTSERAPVQESIGALAYAIYQGEILPPKRYSKAWFVKMLDVDDEKTKEANKSRNTAIAKGEKPLEKEKTICSNQLKIQYLNLSKNKINELISELNCDISLLPPLNREAFLAVKK